MPGLWHDRRGAPRRTLHQHRLLSARPAPRVLFLLSAIALLGLEPLQAIPGVGSAHLVTRIAFGSCIDAARPHPLLGEAAERDPDLFIFLGDNVYADAGDPSRFEEAYAELGESEDFRRLEDTATLLAIWDDHDYGVNDSGGSYGLKQKSEEAFLDFWDVPKEDPRRERPGIYTARRFGPPGKRVQIILLDTRWFRSPLSRGNEEEREGPYRPIGDPSATLLGEEQWDWLEDELRKPTEVRIIASSIQVLVEHHGWESWSNFPREQERLFDLLGETGAMDAPLLFISGDRHFGEITRRAVSSQGKREELVEITSSGINRSYPEDQPLTLNRYREGEIVLSYNFGEIRLHWDPSGGVRLVAKLLTGQNQVAREITLPVR